MSDFDPNPHQYQSNGGPTLKSQVQKQSATYSYVKVFGYMFMFLAISTIVAVILGIVFEQWLRNDFDTAYTVLFYSTFAACIFQFILSFIISFTMVRGKYGILIPSIIYSITMGVMLSTFTTFIAWEVLGITFAIAAGIFGLMALLGLVAKGRMTGLTIVISGLSIGIVLMMLFNLIFMFVFPAAFETMYWVISFAVFALIMFVTISDVWQIKKIAQSGELSTNLSLFLAFRLYLDFMVILIRVLYFVLMFSRRN